MTGNALDSTLTERPMERQTSSRYLINEEPVEFLPSLAEVIGVYEAIFLQRLHWWLRGSRHVRKGRRWIWNSYAQWHQQLRFIGEHTLRRIVEKLKRLGLIDTENFNYTSWDRTLWYTINYEAVEALLAASHVSPQAARSCVQVGQMDLPDGTDGFGNLDTLPKMDPKDGSAEILGKGEGERTRAQEVPVTVLEHLVPPAPIPSPASASQTTVVNDPEHPVKPVPIPSPASASQTTVVNDPEHPVKPVPIPSPASASLPTGISDHEHPVRPTKIWSHLKPPDYTPSSMLEAELKSKYPLLNYDDEMEKLQIYEFQTPKSDWDAATRWWFRRGEERRKEKATVGPGKDNGGLRRDTTPTDKRTRDLLWQRQQLHALTEPCTRPPETTALTVPYEDISYVGH